MSKKYIIIFAFILIFLIMQKDTNGNTDANIQAPNLSVINETVYEPITILIDARPIAFSANIEIDILQVEDKITKGIKNETGN